MQLMIKPLQNDTNNDIFSDSKHP